MIVDATDFRSAYRCRSKNFSTSGERELLRLLQLLAWNRASLRLSKEPFDSVNRTRMRTCVSITHALSSRAAKELNTVGEFVGHTVPCNWIESLCSHLSIPVFPLIRLIRRSAASLATDSARHDCTNALTLTP